ncbi:proline-rich protein 36-like [Cheilinus undulatus]|uniref:proline-rich protein 36-like n=1 Tax=Cheilinus undulatus TaxID=241271 RepID=UPI001BD36751|nr:proline-rich protein 36-like [Cheilinus undulatus]
MQQQIQQQQMQQQQQLQQQHQQQQIQQQQQMQQMQMQGLQNAQGQQGMTGPQTSGQGQPQMHPHQLQQQQQQQQTPQPHLQQQQQQQMMMMLKMQQEQTKNRMSVPPGGQLPPRGIANPPEVQRLPVSQQGNMPVMISLQNHGGVPPSPDKARGMPLMVNPQLAGVARRMSHPDVGQGPQGTGSEETSAGTHLKQDRPSGPEIGVQSGNGAQQMMANQGSNTHMLKQGPGPSPMPQHTGASPQQQLTSQPQQGGPMPGIHFSSVPTTSQSSRPKTPNRASPRPYHHPLTPTNRPPSTEPSEINLSPERLNASIAGLFPPKINIPLPPRPNLNRGFDQQGLNPTTLKAIGQAPPSLNLPGNNNGSVGGNNTNQQPFSTGTGGGGTGTKQDKQPGGQVKRASPSSSRRSSPASSRKSATPSPGRQKGTKMANNCPALQQQIMNNQGQTVMLSPTSVPPSPVSMPSQVSGGMEAQQPQNLFHGLQGNPLEGVRDSQGMMSAEQRHILQPQPQPQSMRELSAPRMASPRFPLPQQSKPDSEPQAGTVDRQSAHAEPSQDSEVSPTLRTAPTSLNQLLDNAGIPNMPLRPMQSNTVRDVLGKDSPKSALDPERPHLSTSQSTDMSASVSVTAAFNESEVKPKSAASNPTSNPYMQPTSIPSSHPSINMTSNTSPSLSQNSIPTLGVCPSPHVNPTATLSTNTNATMSVSSNPAISSQSGPASTLSTSSNSNSVLNPPSSSLKPSPSPSPKPVTSVHSVIQIPASSTTIPPNQITVFVTSNPITSAPTPQAPTSMVSTMVAVPNKNIRPQDIRQQTPVPRPQFIATTPVFINPIFQVPGSSVAPNTTVVSQSVTMVGPIQVSTTNIQLSPAPSSAQSSTANMTYTQPNRSSVGQMQIATSMPSSVPVGNPQAPQNNPGTLKTENLVEVGPAQKTSPPIRQPSPHPSPSASSPFQPPMASPPPCSSPGAVNTMRKSPMSPPPTTQVKGKPAQVTAAVTATADVQQSSIERPAGLVGTLPPQTCHPPEGPTAQIEPLVPQTTTAAAPNNIALPTVSSIPIHSQVALPTQFVTQAPLPAPALVTSSSQVLTSKAPIATVVGTTTPTATLPLPPSVTPEQSPVSSIVPICSGPGTVQDVSPSTSSPAANSSGVSAAQSEPPTVESPLQPAAAPAETSQTIQASNQPEAPQSQEPVPSEKPGEEVSTGSEQGQFIWLAKGVHGEINETTWPQHLVCMISMLQYKFTNA